MPNSNEVSAALVADIDRKARFKVSKSLENYAQYLQREAALERHRQLIQPQVERCMRCRWRTFAGEGVLFCPLYRCIQEEEHDDQDKTAYNSTTGDTVKP